MIDTIRKPIPTFFEPQPETQRASFAELQVDNGRQSPSPAEAPRRGLWTSSDIPDSKLTLSPSPAFLEPSKSSKDDTHVNARMPSTPKRPHTAPRGLSLQLSMPPRDVSSSSTANLSTDLTKRVPLSPKLDPSTSYATSASALPRRSRGLDYTRACTNLHHSTLAEQSSPDSSPVIGGGRGMNIPRRGAGGTTGPDSPMFAGALWTHNVGGDKGVVSSSLGSVNMLDSGTDSESSDDDLMRDEDTIHMTPQVGKQTNVLGNSINNPQLMSSPGLDTMGPFGQAASNLLSFQRRTRRGRSTRQSSSSASNTSTMPSPAPSSPPLLKSIEANMSSGYFPGNPTLAESNRRQSLSLGTNDLRISDSVESEEINGRDDGMDPLGIPIGASTTTMDERRNVIRRAVTRRSNMLPKPKTFARIRAALQEEGSPLDFENQREAEVIRQVKESDNSPESTAPASQPATTASSPYLVPSTSNNTDTMDDLSDMMGAGSETASERRPSISFGRPAVSSASEFGGSADARVRTPPPQLLPRMSSAAMSEDMNMDTPNSSMYSMGPRFFDNANNSSPSRSATPAPTVGEMTRKTLGKRRRDDDLDPNMFKRRAVSPGLSLQNSPVLPPSPMQREGGWWSMKANRETPTGHAAGERANSSGSANGSVVGKKVGLQGMTDTNDGMMNMSIE